MTYNYTRSELKFDVLAAVFMEIQISCDVMPRRLLTLNLLAPTTVGAP